MRPVSQQWSSGLEVVERDGGWQGWAHLVMLILQLLQCSVSTLLIFLLATQLGTMLLKGGKAQIGPAWCCCAHVPSGVPRWQLAAAAAGCSWSCWSWDCFAVHQFTWGPVLLLHLLRPWLVSTPWSLAIGLGAKLQHLLLNALHHPHGRERRNLSELWA